MLTTLLKMRFRGIGNACQKIDGKRFALINLAQNKEINLEGDWRLAFSPGQMVQMAMVQWYTRRPTPCPNCEELCDDYIGTEVLW